MILVNAWMFMAMSLLSASAIVAGVLYLGHKIMHRQPKPPKPVSTIVVASTAAVFDEVHRHADVELHNVIAFNGRSR
jgi:fatty acid desaturase